MPFFVTAFLIFSAAFFLAGYYVWVTPQKQSSDLLSARLREVRAATGQRARRGGDLVRREQAGQFAFLGNLVAWIGIGRRLQSYIQQADLKYKPTDVIALTLVLAFGGFLVSGLFFGSDLMLLRAVTGVLLGSIPIGFIMRKRSARLAKFEENLPDAIDLFTRTMRAGHNIHSGLETMAAESVQPIRGEFRKVMDELALGSPIEPALHNLGSRIPIIDLKFFITGLILQRQTGANMVEVLENLAMLVRERLNMAAKMKAHTAQQRFSAGLLCLMPVVVGLGFWVLKPEYIRLLYTDPIGSKFLTYAICSEIVGIIVIRKLANIRV